MANLYIKDINATGGATWNITTPLNGIGGNNTGWNITKLKSGTAARATSNGNFLIPDTMELNEVGQTNFKVNTDNFSIYANEFNEVATDINVVKVIVLESGNTWTVPSDWNTTNNTIHLIGGGASGAGSAYDSFKYLGGGGGGYTKISNFNTTPGSVISYLVGLGGIAGITGGNENLPPVLGANTTFNSSMYIAGGGGRGQANGSIGGIGSTFNGGNGAFTISGAGAGGGGAAGPYGNGGNAIDGLGGVGDAGFGGAANTGGSGLSGTEINGYGSGSGGSAGNLLIYHNGGKYGGGGATGYSFSSGFPPISITVPGSDGANGVIIITYPVSSTSYKQRVSNTGNLLISGTFIESADIQ